MLSVSLSFSLPRSGTDSDGFNQISKSRKLGDRIDPPVPVCQWFDLSRGSRWILDAGKGWDRANESSWDRFDAAIQFVGCLMHNGPVKNAACRLIDREGPWSRMQNVSQGSHPRYLIFRSIIFTFHPFFFFFFLLRLLFSVYTLSKLPGLIETYGTLFNRVNQKIDDRKVCKLT